MEGSHNQSLDWKGKNQTLQLQLEELCRIYHVSLDLIRKSTSPRDLLESILDEYIHRLDEIPGVDMISAQKNGSCYFEKEKIRSLVMFASQAVLLMESSEVYEELREKNEKLEVLSRDLSQSNQKLRDLNAHYLNMLSFVSHELRSPLISVLGFAEILEDGLQGDLNPEQLNSVQIIIRVSRTLIDMIRNYLDLSKIETGELKIRPEPVDVRRQIIEPVVVEMQEQLVRKNMSIVPLNSPTRTQDLWADRELTRIVFTNLFSNAVKYGRENTGIEYDISEEVGQYRFAVRNYGIGVPECKLTQVFNKFVQINNYDADTPRGTGLGLFNTKCIVEGHGGKIWAESKSGEWFKVTFTLPKGKPAATKALDSVGEPVCVVAEPWDIAVSGPLSPSECTNLAVEEGVELRDGS